MTYPPLGARSRSDTAVDTMHASCLTPSLDASLAERLYCAYNAGGDPATAGLNYQGAPCPAWGALPENIRAKWESAAGMGIAVASRFLAGEGDAGSTENLPFGAALALMKAGSTVARAGWNGKGMYIYLSGLDGVRGVPTANLWALPSRRIAQSLGGSAPVLPCVCMRTADGKILMGWLASQTDMLADDWMLIA